MSYALTHLVAIGEACEVTECPSPLQNIVPCEFVDGERHVYCVYHYEELRHSEPVAERE